MTCVHVRAKRIALEVAFLMFTACIQCSLYNNCTAQIKLILFIFFKLKKKPHLKFQQWFTFILVLGVDAKTNNDDIAFRSE